MVRSVADTVASPSPSHSFKHRPLELGFRGYPPMSSPTTMKICPCGQWASVLGENSDVLRTRPPERRQVYRAFGMLMLGNDRK